MDREVAFYIAKGYLRDIDEKYINSVLKILYAYAAKSQQKSMEAQRGGGD